jgi:hypothetical protein
VWDEKRRRVLARSQNSQEKWREGKTGHRLRMQGVGALEVGKRPMSESQSRAG